MKTIKIFLGALGIYFCSGSLLAQVTPFSLPPKWYFGHRAGLDFTGGAPVNLTGNVNDGPTYENQEGCTTECFPNGNVVLYSNSCILRDATHTTRGPNPMNGGGNSSTQGVICVPNPSSPTNRYFVITASVDASGGSNCTTTSAGIFVYPINASVTPFTVGAPTTLATGFAGSLNESIAVSSDLNDGYWVVTAKFNSGLGEIDFLAWHITNTGTINTTPVTSVAATSTWNFQPQGTIKFNKCNNRIAYVQHGNATNYWAYNWDAATGTATSLINSGATGNTFNYGVEFSPNGNMIYTTGLNTSDVLTQINLSNGSVQTLATTSLNTSTGWGNLNLGLDNKIYISHSYAYNDAGPKYLGVISTPNSTTTGGAGYNATGYTLSAGLNPSTQNGLITLGWHNPVLTITETTSPCTKFSYTYQQYYGTAIPVVANSEEWDFGDGSGWHTGLGATPTKNYAANTNYTVKLRLKDQNCQVLYASQKDITVSCVLPVELINFSADKSESEVLLHWSTQQEINNDYFDVQRSQDGIHFSSIGTVHGNGNTSSITNYSFTDAAPLSGTNYYRLIQHDFDGATQNSNVLSVEIEGIALNVFPNPSQNNFNVQIASGSNGTLIVTDVLGREVYRKELNNNMMEFSFGNSLSKGLYTLKIISDREIKTVKLEKE